VSAAAAPAEALSPDSKYLSDKADIIASLKQLRDRRLDLTVRVENQKDTYTCKVLDVSEQAFLIEDISPRTGIQVLRTAQRFSISARAAGTFAYIEATRVLKWDQERGVPYFHVALPDRMLFQHRRRAARYRQPLRVSANGASITLFGNTNLVGRIIDISVGGCRAEFDLPAPEAIHNEALFENCAITIPNLLEIHSEIVVRHCHENKHSRSLVCGLELTDMHVTDRRRLEQFIQNISRSASPA